ncbi:MAG: transposase, partial [Pirellulaceae bacterium]|nr:transposase [Pirellulaceae bacterium]
HRVALSDHRIKAVDESSVTYQYKPKQSQRVLSRTVSGEAFVKSFAQHILPTGFRKVRYYGWMASNSKAKLEELRMVVWFSVGLVYWLASGHAPQKPIKPFPKVCCLACGAPMRVIAISDHPIRPTLSTHSRAYLDSG